MASIFLNRLFLIPVFLIPIFVSGLITILETEFFKTFRTKSVPYIAASIVGLFSFISILILLVKNTPESLMLAIIIALISSLLQMILLSIAISRDKNNSTLHVTLKAISIFLSALVVLLLFISLFHLFAIGVRN